MATLAFAPLPGRDRVIDDVTKECRAARELSAVIAWRGKPGLIRGLDHARAVVADWVVGYNADRPHSALSHQNPAAFAAQLTIMGDQLHETETFRGRLWRPRCHSAKLNLELRDQLGECSGGTAIRVEFSGNQDG